MDEVSVCNFSNYPKDIHLEEDAISEGDIFMRPLPQEAHIHRQLNLSVRKSFGTVVADLDDEQDVETPKIDLNSKAKFDMVAPPGLPASTGNSRGEDLNKPFTSFGSTN